jgi:hypothetical protein
VSRKKKIEERSPDMTKMTLHTQALPNWLPNFLAASGSGYIKCIDAFYDPVSNRVYRNTSGYDVRGIYIYPQLQDVKVIGRTFMPDSDSNALIWQGAAGADSWFNGWWPTYWANPHVWAWEGPNEPQPMADANFRVKLDLFTSRLADLMQNAGLRLVGHNFGVGWPDIGHGPQFAASITKLHDYGFYLGLHEYSAPAMWDGVGFYCLRYRNLMQELQGAGVPIPQIVIGECGLDGGVISPPPPYVGWKTLCNNDPACYIEQLLWYETELRKDAEVECASIFTAGAYDPWYDFEMEEGISMTLADELANLPDPPLEVRAKGLLLRENEPVTQAQLQAAWDAGYRFVMIRATVGLTTDTEFVSHWDAAGQVGFLRAVFHWLSPTDDGQAGYFAGVLDGRSPEMGFYLTPGSDATLEKTQSFLDAADGLLGLIHIRSSRGWMDPKGPVPWEQEGRKLSLVGVSDDEDPILPVQYTTWNTWLNEVGEPPWYTGSIRLMVYNGTNTDLYAEYGGNEEVIAELLLAQAKNAEVAAHIANALALLQGQQ